MLMWQLSCITKERGASLIFGLEEAAFTTGEVDFPRRVFLTGNEDRFHGLGAVWCYYYVPHAHTLSYIIRKCHTL